MVWNSVVHDKPFEATSVHLAAEKSAREIVEAALRLEGVTDKHRVEVLSLGIWKWTEARGIAPHAKYNVRYVTRGVREARERVKINHEHVFTRKWLIAELLKGERGPHELLAEYGVACTVTTPEHADLGAVSGQGWARYLMAGVEVWDRLNQRYLTEAELRGAPDTVSLEAESDYEEADETTVADQADERRTASVADAIDQRANAATRPHLRRLMRTADFLGGVSVLQGKPLASSTYFRIHDATVDEPTPTVAYANWTGRIDYRLVPEDVADLLPDDDIVERPTDRRAYRIRVKPTDERTLELAEDLLRLAMEKVREGSAS